MRAFHARDWGSNPHSSTFTLMVLFSHRESVNLRKRTAEISDRTENISHTMILRHASEAPAVPMNKPGFSGMHARFLLTADEGCPGYAMRVMEFAPGGHCSFHNHKEEHEIYLLEGEGILRTEKEGESTIRAGDAILLMPCEFHQIRNTGTGMLKMICTVPLLPGKTGKETTPCG